MNYLESFLVSTPLFQGMSPLELTAISAFLERRFYKRGALVFNEGEDGQELFIVLSGLVVSFVMQSDGTKRKIYEFGKGRFFGEMAVIENAPRSASCWAEEDTELLVLDGLDFYRLVFEHPMIGLKLLNAIGRVMTSWLAESSLFLSDMVRWGETARRRAVMDPLTGLYNRRFLEESLSSRFVRSSGGRSISMVMMDLDHFRSINEQFGQSAGDAFLSEVGKAVRATIREGDIAAHLSGDEFAFFLPDTGYEVALEVAERIRRAIEALRPTAQGKFLRASASLGVAAAPLDGNDSASLCAAADQALFRAKESGRNRVAGSRPLVR